MTAQAYNAHISARIDLHDELRIFKITPQDFEVPFTPGQYVEIGLYPETNEDAGIQKIIRRQYSLASSAINPRELEVYIVLVEQGALTSPLWQLQVGDPLWVNPKSKGKFTLDEVTPQRNILCFATGTGLAPFISMLRTYRDNPPWLSFTLIHGVRIAKDLGYQDELLDYCATDSRIRYLPCVSRETSFAGLTGRIPQRLEDGSLEQALGRTLQPETDQALLCGNPAMIDEVTKLLQDKGFLPHKRKNPGNIHFERYW